MSKAEELALKLIIPKQVNNIEELCRFFYIKGYHQTEEELIDKAIGWIGEFYNYHEIIRYSDSREPPLSELIEWFKNYMKEENINSK